MAVTIAEQRYGPTTGTASGWAGLVLSAAGVAGLLAVPSTGRVRFALVLAVAGLLVWCYLVRPRVIVREAGTLVLRNAFSSWVVPLAAITVVQVKAITRVEAGGRGYDGIAVGRRIKSMVRGRPVPRGSGFAPAGPGLDDPPRRDLRRPVANTPEAVADLMTEQILAAAARAREAGQPAGDVQRRWAVAELTLLGALLVGLGVTLLV